MSISCIPTRVFDFFRVLQDLVSTCHVFVIHVIHLVNV